jgi:sarcosine oxidase subunit beta
MVHRDRVTGVLVGSSTIATGAVVVAAGAWANALLHPLGLDFGLRPRLSRVCVLRPSEFEADEKLPTVVDRLEEAWFRPMPTGAILVGTERTGVLDIDPNSFPEFAPSELLDGYRGILAKRFAVSAHAAPRGAWSGVYMLSPDHRPLIGPVLDVDGMFVIAGDSGTSFKLAPAIGLGMAEVVLDGDGRSFDLASFGPERFQRHPGDVKASVRRHAATISR